MRGEILGAERRHFWHDDDKLEIVASVGIAGASVTQVAQRHAIKRQQIYAWRHELKKKGLWLPDAGALFFPEDLPVTQAPVAEAPPSVAVELRLHGRRSLHFESAIDPAALSALIRVVDATCSAWAPVCVCIWTVGSRICARGSQGWRR